MDQFLNQDPSTDARFLGQLRREVEAWEEDGTISSEQARAILSRYPAEASLGAIRRRNSLVVGVSILGSVLVGLGIIAFFAANWDEISKGVRLGVLIAGVLLAYGAGFLLWQRFAYTALGVALVLLGCIIYGAGVHLIGQIYHIPVDHPDLIAFWFLGVLPLAYVTRSRPITALAIVLFLAAVAFRLKYWEEFVGDTETVAIFALYVSLGLAIYSLGRAKEQLPEWEQIGTVFRAMGLVVAMGALYVLTFHDVQEDNGRLEGLALRYWSLAYASAVCAILLTGWAAWSSWRRSGTSIINLVEAAAFVLLLAAGHLVVHIPAADHVIYTIVFNVLFALSALGLMISGYMLESEGRVNFALALIALYLVSRYFEFSLQLLDTSMVFVGAGVVLLAGGFLLERGRRKMLAGMRYGEREE